MVMSHSELKGSFKKYYSTHIKEQQKKRTLSLHFQKFGNTSRIAIFRNTWLLIQHYTVYITLQLFLWQFFQFLFKVNYLTLQCLRCSLGEKSSVSSEGDNIVFIFSMSFSIVFTSDSIASTSYIFRNNHSTYSLLKSLKCKTNDGLAAI